MRKHPWFTVVVFFITVVGGLATAKYLQISALIAYAESMPPENKSVQVANAKGVIFRNSVLINGVVIASADVTFVAEVGGRITGVNATSGSQVQASQVLLQLDDSEEQAELAAAKARLNIAKLALERSKSLQDKSLSSKEQVDIALAQQQSAAADIDRINAKIRKKQVIAPTQGYIGLHTLNVGEYVHAGQSLFRLIDSNQPFWIDFNLPQTLPEPGIGDALDILDANDTLIGTATVIASDAWFSDAGRQKTIRLQMNSKTYAINSGEYVKVRVWLDSDSNAISIPLTSLRWDSQGPFLYAVVSSEAGSFLPHKAQKRRITVHAQEGDRYIVSGEIKDGETIASEGSFKLSNNMLINAASLSAGK